MPKYLKNKRKRRYKNSNFKNVDTIEMSSEEKKQSRTKAEKKSSFRQSAESVRDFMTFPMSIL